MSGPQLYSQFDSEKRADENVVCRQIVREINNFGITQRQTLMVIYFLACELENVEQMKVLTKTARELGGDDMFLSGRPEPDSVIEGGDDGSIGV